MTYIDGLGRIYTTGYNAEGELGNANTQSTFGPKYQPSLLGDYRFIPSENIVNLKKGESQSVGVTLEMQGLNLLDKSFTSNYTFKSLDTNVVTVSGNTITAARNRNDLCKNSR